MKVALFIGHHKTGSTSLQNYMANSYLTLLRQGILYPAVEAEGMALNLAAALSGQNSRIELDQFNVREPHNALAFRLMNDTTKDEVPAWHPNLPHSFQMLHLIDQQVLALQPDHLVICSEVMSRLADMGKRKILPRLAARLASHDCTIVLNLRRIDEYLSSWHLQRLKFGAQIKPLRGGAYEFYYPNIHFRYDRIVQNWRNAFPAARIVARNYDDVLAAGGSVVDFFAQAGIDHQPIAMEERLNPSIPHALAEVVRLGNLNLPEHRHAVQTYVMQAAERIPYARSADVELFGPVHRAALIAAFAPVHEALSQLLGMDSFFPDMDAAAKCRDIPEMEAARAALVELRKDARAHATHDAVRDFIANLEFED